MMQAHFSVRPKQQRCLENDLAIPAETLDEAESMNASIEGAWEDVVSAIRGCHEAMAVRHPQLVTTVVIVDGADDQGSGFKQQISRFASPFGRIDGQVRALRIPVLS